MHRKWLWLLALPYVVQISTGANDVPMGAKELKLGNEVFWCDPKVNHKCEWFDDFVFMMNDAHCRRNPRDQECNPNVPYFTKGD